MICYCHNSPYFVQQSGKYQNCRALMAWYNRGCPYKIWARKSFLVTESSLVNKIINNWLIFFVTLYFTSLCFNALRRAKCHNHLLKLIAHFNG